LMNIRCHHPEGGFEIFARQDIEQSIPARYVPLDPLYPHERTTFVLGRSRMISFFHTNVGQK